MSIYFKDYNISNTFSVISSVGTTTIDVPFAPDYIKVELRGAIIAKKDSDAFTDDEVYWDLNHISNDVYQLVIGWNVNSESRDIYYRVSRLTVDPV